MREPINLELPPPLPRKSPLRCLLTTTETTYKPRLWIPESICSKRSSQFSQQSDAIDDILAMLEGSWIAQAQGMKTASWRSRERESNVTWTTDTSRYSQYSQFDAQKMMSTSSRSISRVPTVTSQMAISSSAESTSLRSVSRAPTVNTQTGVSSSAESISSRSVSKAPTISSRTAISSSTTTSSRSSQSRDTRTMYLDSERAKLDGAELIMSNSPSKPHKLRKVKSTSLEEQRIQLAEARSKEAAVNIQFPPHPAVRPREGLNIAKPPPVPPIPWMGYKTSSSDLGPMLRKSKSVNFSRKRDTISMRSSSSLPAWI